MSGYSLRRQCGAIVSMVLVVVAATLAAGDEPAQERIKRERASEQQMQQALAQPATLNFKQISLADVCKQLSTEYKLPIMIDRISLSEAAIQEPDSLMIEFSSSDAVLENALELMLDRVDLTFTFKNQILLVTTPEAAEVHLITRVYPVRELMLPKIDGMLVSTSADYEEIIELITTTIEPTTWDAVGGPGSITWHFASHSLAVSQTREVHNHIARLLNDLRHARQEQTGGKPVVDENGLYLLLYPVPEGPLAIPAQATAATPAETPPAEGKPDAEQGDKTNEPKGSWARLLMRTIAPESWEPAGGRGMVIDIPGGLMVRQTAEVHEQVFLALSAAESISTGPPGRYYQGGGMAGGGMGGGGGFPGPRINVNAPLPGQGQGPQMSGDKFAQIVSNQFQEAQAVPLSTFSIDVDTAAYSKSREFLMTGQMPPPGAVRIEEFINYFDYQYAPPTDEHPFAAHLEIAACPWQPEHRLLRIGLKGKELAREQRPACNLVFLIDVSGSMAGWGRLPLATRSLQILADQLNANDRVSIVVYAGAAGMVLPPTAGNNHGVISTALNNLAAGGSTAGGEGLKLAYETAQKNFIKDGVNRIILCTDGDFNVGVTSPGELVDMAEKYAKGGIFLSVLGFGMDNHNEDLLEQISTKANGNHAFIDTENEARKVLAEQMAGTLVTIAQDVKIQVEFNPARVAAYRLIGYENRLLAAEDFNDDKKDAGDIGAGHTVTALYEIVPAIADYVPNLAGVDELKYQTPRDLSPAAASDELLTLKLRYKQPGQETSTRLVFPCRDSGQSFDAASADFRFAAAVAGFGQLLRNSEYKGNFTYEQVHAIAKNATAGETDTYRNEFLTLIDRAKEQTAADLAEAAATQAAEAAAAAAVEQAKQDAADRTDANN